MHNSTNSHLHTGQRYTIYVEIEKFLKNYFFAGQPHESNHSKVCEKQTYQTTEK